MNLLEWIILKKVIIHLRILLKKIIFLKDSIIEIFEIRNKNHISLFFVKKEYHKQGIGKKLFEHYKESIKENDNIKIISVNSSIFAENIYSKLGFLKMNEIQEKNG